METTLLTIACSRRNRLSCRLHAQASRQPPSLLKHVVIVIMIGRSDRLRHCTEGESSCSDS